MKTLNFIPIIGIFVSDIKENPVAILFQTIICLIMIFNNLIF
jgi:hypothetical protein